MFWANDAITNEPLRQNRWYLFLNDDTLKYSVKEFQKPEYNVSFTEHRLLTQTFKLPGLLKWSPINIKLVATIGQKQTLNQILEGMTRAFGYSSPVDYIIKRDVQKDYQYAGTNTIDLSKYNLTADQKKQFEQKNSAQFNKKFNFKQNEYQEIVGSHQQLSNIDPSSDGNRILTPDDYKNIEFRQIDENGVEIESWKLYNCFISSLKYGTVSYELDGFVEVSMTIQYDWALQREDYFAAKSLKEAELQAEREYKKLQNEIFAEAAKLSAEKTAKEKREAEYEKLRALEASEADLRRLAKEGTKEQRAAAEAQLQELDRLKQKEKDYAEEQKKIAKQKEEAETARLQAIADREKIEADQAEEKRKQELEDKAKAQAEAEVNAIIAKGDANSGKEKEDTREGEDARLAAEAADKAANEKGWFQESEQEKQTRLREEARKSDEKEVKNRKEAEEEFARERSQAQADKNAEADRRADALANDRSTLDQADRDKRDAQEADDAEMAAEIKRQEEQKKRVEDQRKAEEERANKKTREDQRQQQAVKEAVDRQDRREAEKSRSETEAKRQEAERKRESDARQQALNQRRAEAADRVKPKQ